MDDNEACKVQIPGTLWFEPGNRVLGCRVLARGNTVTKHKQWQMATVAG